MASNPPPPGGGGDRLFAGMAPDGEMVGAVKRELEGAEAVGMTAVLHRGAETTLPELEGLLGVELRGG